MRYFIEFSYNGKAYHGWQIQPNAISVQEVLEKSLSTLLRKSMQVVGAGRTDAGVHATQMFAHFDVDLAIDEAKLVYKLNSLLPKDIAVKKVFRVANEAHARFDAVKRSYDYRIVNAKHAFLYDYTHCVKQPLNVEEMNRAAQILLSYTDFKCFSKSKTDVHTYDCDITFAQWNIRGDELVFTISANRFLRNMVRAVVGTLLQVGLGKINVEEVHNIINSRDRGKAGTSVPGHALYLTEVVYPESIIYGRSESE